MNDKLVQDMTPQELRALANKLECPWKEGDILYMKRPRYEQCQIVDFYLDEYKFIKQETDNRILVQDMMGAHKSIQHSGAHKSIQHSYTFSTKKEAQESVSRDMEAVLKNSEDELEYMKRDLKETIARKERSIKAQADRLKLIKTNMKGSTNE